MDEHGLPYVYIMILVIGIGTGQKGFKIPGFGKLKNFYVSFELVK